MSERQQEKSISEGGGESIILIRERRERERLAEKSRKQCDQEKIAKCL